jgi:hypothetical protein
MKSEIVYDLIDQLRDHFPALKITRGDYQRSERAYIGAVPEFVRRSYFEITGLSENLDRNIKAIVEMIRIENSSS